MRLIDTEKAWKAAQRIYSDPVLLHAIKNVLDSTEAIEAAPVVHGRWEVHAHPYIKPRQDGWICTSCSFVTEDIANGDTNYCPNCGARMDGDGDA